MRKLMFMEKYAGNDALIQSDEKLRTPSPLSSVSGGDGSGESLLSEINEVYEAIDRTYQLSAGKNGKLKEVNSSHLLTSTKLSNLSQLPETFRGDARQGAKIDFPRTTEDKEVKVEVVKNHSFLIESDDCGVKDARARRRAKMYSLTSSQRRSSGTSSPEERARAEDASVDDKVRYIKFPSSKTRHTHLRIDSRDDLSHLRPNDTDETPDRRPKFPVHLEPLEPPARRRKRRKSEIFSSTSASSTTPGSSGKFAPAIVPQLDLQNCHSPDRSSLTTSRATDADQRDLDINALVDALSSTSVRKNDSSRSQQDEPLKTFRVKEEISEGADMKSHSWRLKPTVAVTNFMREPTASIKCSKLIDDLHDDKAVLNAEVQHQKSHDRLPFTLCENQSISSQLFYPSSTSVFTTQVIYENKKCRCSSSSGSCSTYHSSTGKSADDRWVQPVSAEPAEANSLHTPYSVFFVKNLQAQVDDNVPCVHNTCSHRQLTSTEPAKDDKTIQEDLDVGCSCLRFCQLFRKESRMVGKS